ncbi:MAG: peptidase [Acidobacteria bacterium CG_4_9_14_3_um_filter_49_7]|nr:MAG: peptidase [Acidobacteria bacterium CG_4_9_14_3_um_filter_49_7]
MRKVVIAVLTLTLLVSCGEQGEKKEKNITVTGKQQIAVLQSELDKFAPVKLEIGQAISEKQKNVLRKLVEASDVMNEIYLRQVYVKNPSIRTRLETSADPLDKAKLALFNLYKGPFNRLDHDRPFIGTEPKPVGANFYPEDMTRGEFESVVKDHSDQEKAFESPVTVIRRKDGKLVAVPYSLEYKELLTKAAGLLQEAAAFADNETVKTYLQKRADAFLSNDYFDSDMAWMDMKNNMVEAVIGPYEVYEDGLFGYKASFESFITVRDAVESEKLKMVARYLEAMEKNLPIPEQYKNFSRGNLSPIVVANEVYCAGDAASGVQTTAFNLPNDEKVREAKGSKKVLLKNVAKAKYEKCWIPITNRVMDPETLKNVSFDAYFTHTLLHEMSHGLGPGNIVKDGRQTTVNKELKDLYSTIEEAKADVLGVYNGYFLTDKGQFAKGFGDQLAATFVSGIFRSVRFGINEAHGGGNIVIFNYLTDIGVISFDKNTERFSVRLDKAREGFTKLAKALLTMQATGDYARTKQFVHTYKVIRPQMKQALETLRDIPVDIRPVFPEI